MYSEQLTPHEITIVVALVVVTIILRLLKDTPLGFLWRIYKLFWLVLFATLMANYLKKEIKDWWNKN
jgi:energy-coupling factor transporter transmembrane protein EcfT